MALQCGIVGLPNVGKSTLFNCLSNAKAQAANFPFCTIEPNVGVITVPDDSFYSKQKKGDIMNRIGPDVQEVEWSIISSLQALCRDPFLLIAYLIALLKVNTLLTLLSLVLLPAIGYLITIVGKSIQRNSKNAQQILGKMSSLFEETIGGHQEGSLQEYGNPGK